MYYIFLSTGQALAERNLLPAVVGLWLPNALFAALGTQLFARALREQPAIGTDWLEHRLDDLRRWLAGRLGAEA